MDAGYAVLAFIVGFILVMILWGIAGISPIMILRLVFGGSESVSGLPDTAPTIMSSSELGVPSSSPSSLETDGRRTETTTPQPKFTEDQLLTLYTLMREYKVPRDRAGQTFKAMGIPMNNNLWAKAQVPTPPPAEDDDVLVTPFAGRRTRASFYPDSPDLEYNDPPR